MCYVTELLTPPELKLIFIRKLHPRKISKSLNLHQGRAVANELPLFATKFGREQDST